MDLFMKEMDGDKATYLVILYFIDLIINRKRKLLKSKNNWP